MDKTVFFSFPLTSDILELAETIVIGIIINQFIILIIKVIFLNFYLYIIIIFLFVMQNATLL